MQQTLSVTFALTIESVLQLTTTTLPNGIVGKPYSFQLAATGGIAPYTFSLTGLPAGLTCSAAGLVSGTPTTSGSYTVSGTITDSGV